MGFGWGGAWGGGWGEGWGVGVGWEMGVGMGNKVWACECRGGSSRAAGTLSHFLLVPSTGMGRAQSRRMNTEGVNE